MAKKFETIANNIMQELGINDRVEEVSFETISLSGWRFIFCGIRMTGGFVIPGRPTFIDNDIGKQRSFYNAIEEMCRLEGIELPQDLLAP